ncbi:MAG: iron transporter [Acetatifactor sp.]|nr:iron transporter [Acetatifactor sp.]
MEDGVYAVEFDTDSSMFHVNEIFEGKGTLTVSDKKGTLHIVMPSQNTVSLFLGSAEDAQKEGADLIEATVEEVTYSDGLTEEVHAFDVPVSVLTDEFELALVGTKGKWYDHKVSVSDPERISEYMIYVGLEGGSGKASIASPARVVEQDGKKLVTLTWSSPNYDYMIVGDVKYEPVNTEGNSVFEIPFESLKEPVKVIADTVAMSTPHEIEYTLSFDRSTISLQ